MMDEQSEAKFIPNFPMEYKCDKNGLIQYSGDQDPFCTKKCIHPVVDTIARKTNYPLRADPCEVSTPHKVLEQRLNKIAQYTVSYHNAVGEQGTSWSTAKVQEWRNKIKTSFPGLWEKDPHWLGHVTSGESVKAIGDACIVINTEQDRIDYRNPETGKKHALGYFQCDHLTVLRRNSAGVPSKGPHDLDYCRATVSGQVRGEFITKEYKVWTILKTYPACTIWDHFYPNSKCGTQDKRYEGVKRLTEEIKGLTKAETKLLIDFTSIIHAFNKSNCWTKYYENVGLQIDQRHCPIEKKFYRIGDLVFQGREFINATHQLTGSNKHDEL